jgi:hypothetical protein
MSWLRYFAIKEELIGLRASLEEIRKVAGVEVGEFYHVRSNSEHARLVIRTVDLKKEMDFMMGLAEDRARGEPSVSTCQQIDLLRNVWRPLTSGRRGG